MKKDNFNEWYKNSFEQLREEPPADVWDAIQSELDVEEVWVRVDKRLTFFNRRSAIARWSYGIAAALLVIGGGLWMSNTLSTVEPVAQKAGRYERIVRMKGAVSDPVTHPGKSANDQEDAVSFPISSKGTSSNGGVVMATTGIPGSRHSASKGLHDKKYGIGLSDPSMVALSIDSQELESSRLLEVLLPENMTDRYLASSFDPSVSPDSMIQARSLQGFGIGAVTSYNNTWIMNSITYAGLKSKALYRSRVSMASAYGLNASYDINTLWGMEASFMNSTQRQVYSYFNRAGEYKEKTNTLEYLQGTFLLKKKKPVLCGGKYNGIIRTFAFGPTFRHLYSALDETNGLIKGASYQYSKSDYGITLDYGYDIPVMKKIMLSPGITGYAGIKDIGRGKQVEPTHFNRTHNASIGLRISARYIFSKR